MGQQVISSAISTYGPELNSPGISAIQEARFCCNARRPIIKNRTFFFGSVEPLRSQVSQAGSVQTFESPEFVSFAQQHFPNSLGTQILTQYPLANVGFTGVNKTAQDVFGSTCGTAATAFMPCNMPLIDEGRFQPSPFRNALQYSGRLDQYFHDGRDRFYFNLYKVDLDTEHIANRKGFYDVENNNTNAYQLSYTHLFSSTVINDFSYGQIRVQGSSGETAGIPFRVPNIIIDQQSIGNNPAWGPATFIQHNYNWRDVVSWVKGSHSLKFGFEYWTGDDDAQFAGPYERPQFNFSNLLDLVEDKPYEESGVNFNPVTGQVSNGAYRHLLATEGLFVQDEWKLKPNLTVTYGLRWDDYGNPHADLKTGLEGNVFPGPGSTLNEQFANASVRNVANVYAGRLANNWSPRIGVAYDPSKSGNWVHSRRNRTLPRLDSAWRSQPRSAKPSRFNNSRLPRRRSNSANLFAGHFRHAPIRISVPHHSGWSRGRARRRSGHSRECRRN